MRGCATCCLWIIPEFMELKTVQYCTSLRMLIFYKGFHLFQVSWYCPLESPTALQLRFILTWFSIIFCERLRLPNIPSRTFLILGERWNPATLTTKHISVLIVFPLLSFLFILNSRNMLGRGTAHSFIQTAPTGPKQIMSRDTCSLF